MAIRTTEPGSGWDIDGGRGKGRWDAIATSLRELMSRPCSPCDSSTLSELPQIHQRTNSDGDEEPASRAPSVRADQLY